jgi:hypothetical protein
LLPGSLARLMPISSCLSRCTSRTLATAVERFVGRTTADQGQQLTSETPDQTLVRAKEARDRRDDRLPEAVA